MEARNNLHGVLLLPLIDQVVLGPTVWKKRKMAVKKTILFTKVFVVLSRKVSRMLLIYRSRSNGF